MAAPHGGIADKRSKMVTKGNRRSPRPHACTRQKDSTKRRYPPEELKRTARARNDGHPYVETDKIPLKQHHAPADEAREQC